MRSHPAESRYVWLVCGTAVLLFDTGAALASRGWGFDYRSLAPVWFILYFCAGVGGGRIAGVLAGGVAGAITALVQATLGWAIATALGVSGSSPPIGAVAAVMVALGVVVVGWGLGLAGGVLGKVVHSHLVGPSKP
jgi:hypothetical protein